MKTEIRKKNLVFSMSLVVFSNILTGILAFLISLFLTAYFLAGTEVAHAEKPTISTTSTISNGAIGPIATSASNPVSVSPSNTMTITVLDP